MHPGRKILNLRCDRKISQQELARGCDITPSALSKIEAGINSPRAHIIWRIAERLGVTVEYLLDEEIPYPYQGYAYRQELYSKNVDPDSTLSMKVTREEKAFLEALRKCNRVAREIAIAVPETGVETLRMIHFLIHNAQVPASSPALLGEVKRVLADAKQRSIQRRAVEDPLEGADDAEDDADPDRAGGNGNARRNSPDGRRSSSGSSSATAGSSSPSPSAAPRTLSPAARRRATPRNLAD